MNADALRASIQASRQHAVEERLAAFKSDCHRLLANPTSFIIRLSVLTSVANKHARSATAELPSDLCAILDAHIAAHVQTLL